MTIITDVHFWGGAILLFGAFVWMFRSVMTPSIANKVKRVLKKNDKLETRLVLLYQEYENIPRYSDFVDVTDKQKTIIENRIKKINGELDRISRQTKRYRKEVFWLIRPHLKQELIVAGGAVVGFLFWFFWKNKALIF